MLAGSSQNGLPGSASSEADQRRAADLLVATVRLAGAFRTAVFFAAGALRTAVLRAAGAFLAGARLVVVVLRAVVAFLTAAGAGAAATLPAFLTASATIGQAPLAN